jgi:hypothetical protein
MTNVRTGVPETLTSKFLGKSECEGITKDFFFFLRTGMVLESYCENLPQGTLFKK